MLRVFLLAALPLFLLFVSPALAGADEESSDPDQKRKTEEILLVSSAAADLISTELFLARGIEEANPLGRNRAARIGIKAGATALILWVARDLERDGHDKTASILRLVTAGGWFGATGWNIHATVSW